MNHLFIGVLVLGCLFEPPLILFLAGILLVGWWVA